MEQVKKRTAVLEVDKEVDITVRTVFSPSNGSEYSYPFCAVPPRSLKDFRTPFAHQLAEAGRSNICHCLMVCPVVAHCGGRFYPAEVWVAS